MEYQYQYQYSGAAAHQDGGAMSATPKFPNADARDGGPRLMESGFHYQQDGAMGQPGVERMNYPSPGPGPRHQFAMAHEGGATTVGTTYTNQSHHGFDSQAGGAMSHHDTSMSQDREAMFGLHQDSGTGAFPHGYFDRMPDDEIATGPATQNPGVTITVSHEEEDIMTGHGHPDIGATSRSERAFPTAFLDDGAYHEIGGTMSHHDLPSSHNESYSLNELTNMSLGNAVCTRCQEGFSAHEKIVNSNGEIWHTQCFVCAQCFRPFPEGIFYEFEGRKYCEHDFHVLFAPCCGKCREFIVGRVIKAMNNNWHPDCFRCELCTGPLADAGFVKNAGRALCRECNAKEKASGTGKYVCHKCHAIIEEGHLKFKGEVYHPYHFNCTSCGIELNSDAREKNLELYCLRCHDKMGIPICGACRRPIEERVVHALGKAWHVEHFVCAKCEKPFLGHRHYEKKGLAYCETHYHQLFGNICFVCNTVITGDVFSALNKAWCVNHFACAFCDKKMSQKTKFYDYDLRPVCKFCYDKFPSELKKRLKKAYEEQPRK